eukprot:13330076-Ditylum_brightwellii.AAC.1
MLKELAMQPKPPKGSYNLEQFLEQLEMELRTKVLEKGQSHTSKDKKSNNFFSKLSQALSDAVVPMDKINGHRLVNLNDYISWVKQHMHEAATPIKYQEIVKLHHLAINYAKQLEDLLSGSKLAFLNEGITSRAIPEPHHFIKDHKKHNGDHFPRCLVIPATIFAATFLKIGHMGIKKILDDNKINHSKYTITQASDLKTKLENLQLKKPD